MSYQHFHDTACCRFSFSLFILVISVTQECIVETDYGDRAVFSTSCTGVFARLALTLHAVDAPTAKREVCDGMFQHLLTRWSRWRSNNFGRCTLFYIILDDTCIVPGFNFLNWTDVALCLFNAKICLDLPRDLPVKFAGINFVSYGELWLPIGYTFATCLIKGDLLASSTGT